MSDPYAPNATPPAGASGLSIASAACGGVSLATALTGFCCGPLLCLSFPLALVGIVLGVVSRQAIGAGTASPASGTPAMIGIATGAISVVVQIGAVTFAVVMGGLSAIMDNANF